MLLAISRLPSRVVERRRRFLDRRIDFLPSHVLNAGKVRCEPDDNRKISF